MRTPRQLDPDRAAALALSEARETVRNLERAGKELSYALANTRDPVVTARAGEAERITRAALKRARLILKDHDLKTAPQPGLGLDVREGA
jgi:hypothetical protein